MNTDDKGAATAKLQQVKVALVEGQVTILDSGVEKGQAVVVDGADRLRNGQAVVATFAKQHTGKGPGSGQGAAAQQDGGQQGSGRAQRHRAADNRRVGAELDTPQVPAQANRRLRSSSEP